MLNYITPDRVHVMMAGRIVKSGGPELAHELEDKGYEGIRQELGLEEDAAVEDGCDMGDDTMGGLDVERIRADFPILERTVDEHPLVYLDTAATSQKPQVR